MNMRPFWLSDLTLIISLHFRYKISQWWNLSNEFWRSFGKILPSLLFTKSSSLPKASLGSGIKVFRSSNGFLGNHRVIDGRHRPEFRKRGIGWVNGP
jgi:hypothetical protein